MGDWIRFFIGTPKRFLSIMAIFLVAYFLNSPFLVSTDSENPTPESLSSKLGISVSVIREFLSLDFNLDPEIFKEGERIEFLDKLACGEIQSGSYPEYLKEKKQKEQEEGGCKKENASERNIWSILKERWSIFIPLFQITIIILVGLFMLRSIIRSGPKGMR